MLFHSRHRRGSYALAPESPFPQIIRWALLGLALLIFVYLAGSFFLRLFGVGNAIRHTATSLSLEGRGTVNVYLEGGELQRAQDGMKLYPGDRLTTGKASNATLRFFDGTIVRLDEQSDMTVSESAQGEKISEITLALEDGGVWVSTPTVKAFSGTITRTLQTPMMVYGIPSDTEAILEPLRALAYSADGMGIQIEIRNTNYDAFYLGEGQQIELPGIEDLGSDLYTYRKALDPVASRSTFLEESRVRRSIITKKPVAAKPGTTSSGSQTVGFLNVISPVNNAVLPSGTVKVEGMYGEGVASIKVNEYNAVLVADRKTFSQELALPTGEGEFEIQVTALSANGEVLEETRRTVKRDLKAPDSPTITAPAIQGQIWQTARQELVLRGKAPANAVGIIVNEYRLQLYSPEKAEWSYLASTRLGNYVFGENTFNVVAIDSNGTKSAPAVLKIILGEGLTEGVVAGSATSATPPPPAGTSASSENPAQLPNNAPLTPGSVTVTGPTAGTAHTATGSEFLIEGTTSASTNSMWVNDYKLQLYTSGKTFWNYIANTEYQNLKRGKNVYVVVARNAKGEILDKIEYTVTYNP
ncbi:MAG TPA: FecR domain-containing protein [Candidatus Peribacteraceae bacterium]|nr:FecR domain-containing protein [Candidatus Peribacteraceae bacterium]